MLRTWWLNVTVIGDQDAYSDIDAFGAGARNELHALEAAIRTAAIA